MSCHCPLQGFACREPVWASYVELIDCYLLLLALARWYLLKREMPAIVYLLPATHFTSTALSSFTTCIFFPNMCYYYIFTYFPQIFEQLKF